jgi:phosphoenolpyruvate phosphomutase
MSELVADSECLRPHSAPSVRDNPMKMRALLNSPTTSFLMEAHDGLSARIVRDAGFAGIWASGLAISTASGAGHARIHD